MRRDPVIEPYSTADDATLYHGDALAVLRDLDDGSVDAVITDPPYSSGGMVRGDRMQDVRTKYVTSDSAGMALPEFTGDNRDQLGYAYWCALWLSECRRVLVPGGVVALFTDWRQLPTTTNLLQAGGLVWRGILPWYKPNGRPTPGRFANQCEYCAWATNGPRSLDALDNALPGFVQLNTPREREHITQKPVELLRAIVRIAPAGAAVLDPFMGTGTTGVAAMLERRAFVGIEMVEHYAEVAQRRIRTARGETVAHGAQSALPFDAAPAEAARV